jgi:hypothetical protein
MTVRTYEIKLATCVICGEPHQDCSTPLGGHGLRMSVERGDLLRFEVCESCVRNMAKPFTVERAEKAEAKLAQVEQLAGNVMARIHGDGGHYITEHGWEKATADADAIVCYLRERVAVLEEEIRSARPVLAKRAQKKWEAWQGASTGEVMLKSVEGDRVYVRAAHTIHEPAVMTKAEFEARYGSKT